jgi:hypothetical protein
MAKPKFYDKQKNVEAADALFMDLAATLKSAKTLNTDDPNYQRRIAVAMTNAEQAQLWYNAAMDALESFEEDDNA